MKKIAVGCILAFFMLMMLPSVSAVEYNTIVEIRKSTFLEKIQSMDNNKLKELAEAYLEKGGNYGEWSLLGLFFTILGALCWFSTDAISHITGLYGPVSTILFWIGVFFFFIADIFGVEYGIP